MILLSSRVRIPLFPKISYWLLWKTILYPFFTRSCYGDLSSSCSFLDSNIQSSETITSSFTQSNVTCKSDILTKEIRQSLSVITSSIPHYLNGDVANFDIELSFYTGNIVTNKNTDLTANVLIFNSKGYHISNTTLGNLFIQENTYSNAIAQSVYFDFSNVDIGTFDSVISVYGNVKIDGEIDYSEFSNGEVEIARYDLSDASLSTIPRVDYLVIGNWRIITDGQGDLKFQYRKCASDDWTDSGQSITMNYNGWWNKKNNICTL